MLPGIYFKSYCYKNAYFKTFKPASSATDQDARQILLKADKFKSSPDILELIIKNVEFYKRIRGLTQFLFNKNSAYFEKG